MRHATRHTLVASTMAIVWMLAAGIGEAQTADGSSRTLDLTVQLGFGGHLGESPSSQAGAAAIELGYRPGDWTFLVRSEILALSQACADGLSGGCRYPSGGLLGFSVGVRRSIRVSDRLVPYVGAAGGLHVWTEGSSDPGAALDVGVAVPTNTRLTLEIGARWRTIWQDPSFSVLTGQLGTRIAF